MKRSFLLLLALPVLSSCGIEDDYYMYDYRYPPPQARLETPYYAAPRYEGSGHYHGHQSAYRRYHGHYGNNNPVIVQTPGNVRGPANVHGHSSQAQPGNNTHGHPSQGQADNSHGHPSQGSVRGSRGRAWNPYGGYQPQAAGNAQGQIKQAVVSPANDNQGNTIHGHD
ncbi:hypothetical protein [Legionella erythra]|uniref:Lipoprotein n=1 Tax=Legionella erythra TaxID=448 RepID=A0A0W0TWG5_LEGER|nr:hypothetical protein [Legionella erythra]KTC99983.1 hypothetical protein Lery_0093 [Legionella erythra]